MNVDEEHRADFIRLAKEYKFSAQSYPADEIFLFLVNYQLFNLY
jgi:hypothetical protein